MTVILELPPEMEAQVTTEAAQSRGVTPEGIENYLLSESALAKDWLRTEEDEAWQHL